jgi:hypothetical protein
MRTIMRPRWLMMCLVSPAVLAGCQMGETRQASPQPVAHCSACTPKSTNQPPLLPTLVQPAYGGTTTAALVSYGTSQPAEPDGGATKAVPAGLVKQQPSGPMVPVVVQSVSGSTTAAAPSVPMMTDADLPPAKSLYPRGEPNPARKSFTDITAHSSFGHAPNYTWISGEATKFRNEWRLRYASVDEIDAHGGSLVLTGDSELDKLKDGEHYKVVGHVEPHATHAGGEAFYVEAVEAAQ